MDKIPMTRRGFQSLEKELTELKSKERPAIIRQIAEAREHGDLSENAEYHAAREKQGFIEGRIKELESILSRSEVIDPAKLSGSIKFGATVSLVDEDTDEESTYQIVGAHEADAEAGKLSAGPGADRQGRRRQRRGEHPRRPAQLRDHHDPLRVVSCR